MAGHYKKLAKPQQRKLTFHQTLYTSLRTNVPKRYLTKLTEFSKVRNYPVSALIEIAIHNELLKEQPFQFDVSWPEGDFIPGAYAEEANRLYQFLVKFGRRGATVETLVHLRHEYGVADPKTVSLAIRELDIADQIEAHKPRMPAQTPDDGMCYRVKSDWSKVKDVDYTDDEEGPL